LSVTPTPFLPFPVTLLPAPLGNFALEGARAMGCDASFFALSLLTACGACIGNSRRLLIKPGWAEPPLLWAALIVPSGGGKTPAFREVTAPIYLRQAQLLRAHSAEWDVYKAEAQNWKDAKKSDRGNEPHEPAPCEHLIVTDTTTEALAVRLQASPRGILLAVDELAAFFLAMNQYKARGGDKQTYLQMHDAATAKIDRKSAVPPTILVPRAFVAICGGIQPGIFRRVIAEEDFESGMAARFLVAMPPIQPGKWTEATISPDTRAALAATMDSLRQLPMGGSADDTYPADVPIGPDAKSLWVEWFDQTHRAEDEYRSAGDDRMASVMAKYRMAAARIALIVHLVKLENDPMELVAPEVNAESMNAGIGIAQWFIGEAQRVYGMLAESEDDRAQRELIEFVQKSGGATTIRELRQKRRRYRNDVQAAEDDLQKLVDAGLGAFEYRMTGGRPARTFVLRGVNGVTVNESPLGDSANGASVDVDGVDASGNDVFGDDGPRH